MLQQTQVPRVLPRYLAFLDGVPDRRRRAPPRRWPTWCGRGTGSATTAAPSTSTAPPVRDRRATASPTPCAGLLALPGVGPYTARAVLAYAYEADAAVVDTNVARILARVGGPPAHAEGGAGGGRRAAPRRARRGRGTRR